MSINDIVTVQHHYFSMNEYLLLATLMLTLLKRQTTHAFATSHQYDMLTL